MKKSIFLFFAAILCAIGMNAAETYRYSGEKDGWAGTQMTVSSDGYYSYYGPVTGAHQFKIGTSTNQWAYNHSYVSKGFNNTDITDLGDWGQDNAYCWSGQEHYILVYHPTTKINSENKVKICASTFLPDDSESDLPEPEPEPTELAYNVTVPAGTKACYICGNMTGWNFTEMTKVDDTQYTITIEGAKKTDEYKYASGSDWGYVEKDANGNEMGNRTYVDGNDVVARWASVYDPDAVEQELTYSVTVPEGTYACYIAMDTDPAQEGWEFNEMTKVDDTHYTFTRTGLKNKTYKYTSGPGWEYVELTAEDGNVADRTWAENDVVAKWTSVYNPTAPTYDYYITGSLVGGWGVKQQGIEKDGELYKATFTELNAGIYEFKITAGDWDHQWNYNNLGAAYEEVSQGVDGEGKPNGNIKIVTEEAKTITVIFDATAGKITLGGLTPYVAPLTYTVTVPAGTEKCYIAGSMNGWAFQEMEAVTGETNKFTITIIGAKETDEYKYACQADWAYAEVIEGGGNRTKWSALDEVTAWNAPAEPVEMASVVLMGVDGDWATGVEMELNPNDANEYMLLCQSITADEPIKIKAVDTQSTVTWCAKLADTSLGTVEKDADGNENIVLEEGKYDFYYKVAENEVWIGTCDETPEVGGEMDLLVTDLVIMEDSDAQMALLMGTDSEVGIEFALMLTGYTGEYNKEYQLSADESVLSLNGEESLVSGSLTKTSVPDKGDVYQGVVYATLMGMYWQFNLTMYYVEVPAIEINVNNATVVEELYDNYVGGTGSEWSLSGNWTYEGEPATVKVTIYDEVDKSVPQAEMQVDVETDYGFVQGNAMVIIDATTMTVQGELSNQMSGAKYKFNISGALPTYPTIRLNIADNKNVLAATNNTKVNVIVNRSFEANDGYYTLCLPFDMQASVVGKAYQISTITEHAAQGINVEFTEVTNMLAGQPYLIKPNDLDNFTVEAVTIKNTTTPVTVTGEGISITMQGMFNRDGKTNGLYWVGNGGYLYNDDVYTNGLCAYFNISTPSGVAPRMRVVTKEDAETGVEDIFSTDAPVKAIVNGQLIIIRDGVKYNVQGQVIR